MPVATLFEEPKMAEQQKFKLTLSRWHKVAERARRLVGEFETSCQQHIAGWSASVLTAEAKFADAVAVEHGVDASFTDIQRLLVAWADIRLALAMANVEFGIADLLGRIEALKAEGELAERLAERPGLDNIGEIHGRLQGREKLIERQSQAAPDREIIRQIDSLSNETMSFLPVSQNWREVCQARAQTARREMLKLNDRLADTNARHVSVWLDTEVAD
jgi:hypothetical protein